MIILVVFFWLSVIVWIGEVLGYTLLLPDIRQRPMSPSRVLELLGTGAYGIAYLLSLLRAPLGLVPYLVKLFIFFVLRIRYEATRTSYFRELLNMCGDFLNLVGTWLLVRVLISPQAWQLLIILCYLPIYAECVRLFAERVPTTFSAAWQLLPHRKIASIFASNGCFTRYCRYYELSNEARAAFIVAALKQRASYDHAVYERMAYLTGFRILSARQGLRGGHVRDVAKGEVFIHASWTSDPWLLIGMALRRTPWSFDPRYQRRPFYYMSGANRVMSLFVLQHACYSLPYFLFQFGHEIRVGRLHFFYVLLRKIFQRPRPGDAPSPDIERRVYVDGTFQTDQFIFWLRKHIGKNTALAEPRALYNDDEVIAELVRSDSIPTVSEIATRYTYPQKYVEEVLLAKVEVAHQEKVNIP